MQPPAPVVKALNRLFIIGKRDTGQSTRVANFLLWWGNAPVYPGFDFACIRSLDEQIVRDMRTLMEFLFDVGFKYPIDLGFESHFIEVARRHHPDICRVLGHCEIKGDYIYADVKEPTENGG